MTNCRCANSRKDRMESGQPVVLCTLGAAGGDETLNSSFCKLEGAATSATTTLSATQLTTARSAVRIMLFMGVIVNRTVGVL